MIGTSYYDCDDCDRKNMLPGKSIAHQVKTGHETSRVNTHTDSNADKEDYE